MSDRAFAEAQQQQEILTGSSPKGILLQRALGGASRVARDLSQIPIHSARISAAQTELKVSRPGDVYENRADQLAEQAMRVTDPELSGPADEDESRASAVRTQHSAARIDPGPGGSVVPSVDRAVLNSGRGRPLDPAIRAFMEPRFGHDFSRVRVHTDELAADAARGMAARAFTSGEHIVFGSRQYAPDSTAGQRLLAHELAHVVQQWSAPAGSGVFRQAIPGPNFSRADFSRLRESGHTLTISSDSYFLPAKLAKNLLRTLAHLLGPAISPPATEGVNAVDFFHAHLVVKKDPATAKYAKEMEDAGLRFKAGLEADMAKAVGRKVTLSKGYPLTPENIGAFQTVVATALPTFGMLLDAASQLPGAAVMYHTFEYNQPSDLKATGGKLGQDDPRKSYVTPLDTNTPVRYTSPAGGYHQEYTEILSFSFLVDGAGAVHVRTFSPGTGFTTLELSAITGTTFPEPLHPEK